MGDIVTALHNLEQRELVRVWQTAAVQPIYGRGAADQRLIEEYLRSLQESRPRG